MKNLSVLTLQVLGVTEKEFFDQMGVHFVGFVGQYGYDRVLSVLGRHVRDFLNGLDNLHEYLKFSYPRMRAPSFICENETRQGELHNSRRMPRKNSGNILSFSDPIYSSIIYNSQQIRFKKKLNSLSYT